MDFSKLLSADIPCECGKTHRAPTKDVLIGAGVIAQLPALVKRYQKQHLLVVCDANTYRAAGEKVCTVIAGAGIAYRLCIVEGEEVIADEKAIDQVTAALFDECDLIVAVGTGTVNDLCKYVSFGAFIDYLIVATAPSMDGFTSGVSAMNLKNMKVTLPSQPPVAVIGDTDVLCAAPADMITDDVCDILGKNICLIDWQMGHIINGEYFCPYIYGLVRDSVNIVTKLTDDIGSRSPEAIARLMEALVLSGIAMSFCGNSRPASGCEHHLSHFWEMQFLEEGKKPVLHGLKVAVGMVAANFLYEKFLNVMPDADRANAFAQAFVFDAWENEIRSIYGRSAQEIVELEKKVHKNGLEGQQKRLISTLEHWDELQKTVSDCLPALNETLALLAKLNAPTCPADFGIEAASVRNAVLYAKDVRDRFTLLQLLWDLGLLPQFADDVTALFTADARFAK